MSQKADLHYTGGGSDKVYHLLQNGTTLHTAYGRRGSGLAMSQAEFPTEAKAAAEFKKKSMEKFNKGYQTAEGISGNVWAYITIDLAKPGSEQTVTQIVDTSKRTDKTPSGFLPQLLNEISEADAQKYINDDAYGAQEKKNGRRHTAIIEDGADPIGSNKLGIIIPTFVTFRYPINKLKLDGEAIGSKLYVFDLLAFNHWSFKDATYAQRYVELLNFCAMYGTTSFEIVPLKTSTADKQELWNRVKSSGGEGIVFKRLDAMYNPGRPNRLGDQLKVIFWQHTQAKVTGITPGKRSVAVACYDKAGANPWKPMGNVTIPANYEMPVIGDFVEIRYKYYYEGGSLFQPQYEGTTDVATAEDTDYMKLLRFTGEGDNDA